MRKVLSVLFLVIPWPLRRLLLISLFGYKIHPTARIGLSIICPDRLEMGPDARIGSFTMCKGLTLLEMGESSYVGNLNWITGFPVHDQTFFSADRGRRPELIVGSHAAITARHYIDCTNSIRIGRYTTVAGYRSQLLTHSIDLYNCRQSSKPISVGEYCFVGTGTVLLGGSALPDYSVLGAGSILNKAHTEAFLLYAGNPARAVKSLPKDMAYFRRSTGFVH